MRNVLLGVLTGWMISLECIAQHTCPICFKNVCICALHESEVDDAGEVLDFEDIGELKPELAESIQHALDVLNDDVIPIETENNGNVLVPIIFNKPLPD